MAAPVDAARINTDVATASSTWNVNVGSPTAGTLLIVYARFSTDPGAVTFTGYTVLGGPDDSDATNDTTIVFYRWADGAEGATDVLSPTNSVKGAAICWEVTGAENPAVSPPQISTVAVGTTSPGTAAPNSVAPADPPQDTLYLAMAGGDGEVGAYTAAPLNYTNLIAADSGTGAAAASNVFCGGASRQITNSSSDNAGAFTHGAHVGGWTAFAVAIRPPAPPLLAPAVVMARGRA